MDHHYHHADILCRMLDEGIEVDDEIEEVCESENMSDSYSEVESEILSKKGIDDFDHHHHDDYDLDCEKTSGNGSDCNANDLRVEDAVHIHGYRRISLDSFETNVQDHRNGNSHPNQVQPSEFLHIEP